MMSFPWNFKRAQNLLLASLVALTLAACGGGGGKGPAQCIPGVSTMAFPAGCPGDNLGTGNPTVSLVLVDSVGATSNKVAPGAPGVLRATVKNAAGVVVPNVAVSFTTTDDTGAFVPNSGTALTDSNGVATLSLTAGRQVGAFTVSATASAAAIGAEVKASLDYAVVSTGLGLPSLSLTLLNVGGAAVSQVSPAAPGTLRATVRDAAGVPVANVSVAFSTNDETGAFVPSTGTALTDANGVATVGLPAGTRVGAFTATASASAAAIGAAVRTNLDYAVVLAGTALPSLTLQLLDANGAATTQLSPAASGSLRATVRNASGAVVPNVAVSFVTTDGTTVFSPNSGTALTNAAGVAAVELPAGRQVGAFTASASANAAAVGAAVRTSLDYAVTSAGTGEPSMSISLVDDGGVAVTRLSPAAPGSLRATLRNAAGAVVPNATVSFTTTDATGSFLPTSGTALTDNNGVATVSLAAGRRVGAFTVSASANPVSIGQVVRASLDYAVTLAGTGSPVLALTLVDANGATVSTVSPDASGKLRAAVTNAFGVPVTGTVVNFSTGDATGAFVPSTGTALTDGNGVATVSIAAGSRVGAFTVTASAMSSGDQVRGSLDYAVVFPSIALGGMSITPSTLSAGGNAAVSVPVTSAGSLFTPPLKVTFTSPCIASGKATMGAEVITQNGVANTSYTDKGCGVADVITASVKLGDATVTQTATITVLPAGAGAIKFVSASITNIALRATGGFGRQEVSTLTFQVFDRTGSALPGALVDFVFSDSNSTTTVGGTTLSPSFATAAADGTVTTLVTAGTVPTSLRVVARIRNAAPAITTLSNILVVSTGVPVQKRFSLSTSIGNCEGRDIDQECSTVTATVGDQFGNPAPDGTAVSFISESGLIGASCVTGSLPEPGATPAGQTTNSVVGPGSGTCSVRLRSGGTRPSNGRVTVLAYLLGEEDFFDANGNNRYDPGESFTDRLRTVFRNDDESGVIAGRPDGSWSAGEPCIGLPGDGTPDCNAPAGNGIYDGVLGQVFNGSAPSNVYVSAQLVQTFSGSEAVITLNPGAGVCPASGVRDGLLRVADVNDNLMPAGSEIYISSGPVFLDPPIAKVRNVVLAVGERNPMGPYIPNYVVPVSCTRSSVLFVKVVTPLKQETIQSFQINP